MEKITYIQFRMDVNKVSLILFLFVSFIAYKLISGEVTIEYISIGGFSLLCFFALNYFHKEAKKMLSDPRYQIGKMTVNLLEITVIGILGVLTLYILLKKGLYGLYTLIKSFDLFLLFFRFAITYLSFKLLASVANIQEVLKWLKSNTWE